MHRRFRTFVAIVAVAALLGLSSTALAGGVDKIDSEPAPAVVDAAFIRPMGLVALGLSSFFYLPVAGITAITRPQELGLVTESMVLKPARFVFSDPLGSH